MRWRNDLAKNPLLRLMAAHLVIGIGAGWGALGILIWLDVAGLRRLIAADHSGWVAVFMLMVFFAITFGSAAMGGAIIGLGRREDGDEAPRSSLRNKLRQPAGALLSPARQSSSRHL